MPKRAVGATSPHGAAASATYEFWLIGIENLRDADRVLAFICIMFNYLYECQRLTPAALSAGALQGGVEVTKK